VIWGRRGRRGSTRAALALLAAVLALALAVGVATAADGTEATTFGKDGIASQTLGIHFFETSFSALSARADGGLEAQRGKRLESYLADGAPDPAVASRPVPYGRRVFPIAGGGSLVLAGSGLTRVGPDGAADPSFGQAGTVRVPAATRAVAEMPSGKILVVGIEAVGPKIITVTITVKVLNADGSAGGGFSVPLPNFEVRTDVPEIVPTPDGGELVVGEGFLLELRADGSPNPAFGTGGLVKELPTQVGARVLPGGAIEAVGTDFEDSPGSSAIGVFRYTAAGAPDTAFGPGGVRRFDLGGTAEAGVASWGADGSVVVGGLVRSATPCPGENPCALPVLVGIDPAGELDRGFGQEGVLSLTALTTPQLKYEGTGVTALARRPDGSIVAAGGTPDGATAFLAAFSPQGALLPSFGEAGIVSVHQPEPASQQLVGLVPQPDGGFLAAGATDVGSEARPVLIRYAADGGLDRSFGDGAGFVVIGASRYAMGFAANAAGNVLVGLYGYRRSSLVLRSAADGAPVTSFGEGGSILLPSEVRVGALDLAGDGEATVLGRDQGGGSDKAVVLRYQPDGEPDRSFGARGELRLHLPNGDAVKGRAALLPGPGGRLLVGGGVGDRFAVADLLPDGRPDPRFGTRGWATASVGGTAKATTLRRIGSHIYLAGTVHDESGVRVVLMRFDADGRLDTGFGDDGLVSVLEPRSVVTEALLPTPRGVLVVVNQGAAPLLYFDRDGTVRPRPVPGHTGYTTNLRATASRGRLVLAWNSFSRSTRTYLPHLAVRPLTGP
jgi:uncharacterized delta-60 repeat protein